MRWILMGGLAAGALTAAPLEVGSWEGGKPWRVPGGAEALHLDPGEAAKVTVGVPVLSEKEIQAGGGWRGVLEVDGFGTESGGKGGLELEALDPATGEVLAQGALELSGRAPRAAWAVIASSEHQGAAADKAFDGDPKTDWHSRYGDKKAKGPHWIGLEFGSAEEIGGITFLPRQGGYSNGVPKRWRLEIRQTGSEWEVAKRGESDRAVAKDRPALEMRLKKPVVVEAVRVVIESDWSGGGFGTAAEITVLGYELPEDVDALTAKARAWLEIPAATMGKLAGQEFGVRLRSTGTEPVVVGAARLARVSTAPSPKLFGRSNGGLGPDKLGGGLLGFDAMTEHRQAVLPVMTVRKGSAAEQAGLVAGDLIVSVDSLPLPLNDLAPGWNWHRQSHEAVLGRRGEAVLGANRGSGGRSSLKLGVLREGKQVELPLVLNRETPFTSMNPSTDPEAAKMLEDLIAYVARTQREDGSWSRDIKRTTFAALALMATRDKAHRAAVERAVEWSMQRFPEPEKYGNLGFWAGAYAGILYSEWHLATGDERVLPYLESLRDWVMAGQHPCRWGVPALGHGPSGLPYGNKSLVAPACHLLVYEALASRCGMESQIWELLQPYMEMSWSDPEDGGHGAMGYNRSAKDLGEFFSRTGLYAMAAQLRGEQARMRDSMTAIMEKRHPWIRNSHAYGEPGGAWGLLALNLAAPERYARVLEEYAWWFSLAWEPGYGLRFTTPHMGAPYMGEDDLINPAYALVLQGPKKSLHLTGASDQGWWQE